jgi:subtilisin family serine protease
LTRTDLSSSAIQENQYLRTIHRTTGSSVLSRTKLVVTFGVGVVGKHGVVNDRQGDFTLHAVQNKFSQRNPTQELSSFVEHATRHIGQDQQSLALWQNAIRDLNLVANSPRSSSEATLCPDHLLSLEFITPSQLVLGNLAPYLDAVPASYRQSCVLSLFSHFLTAYSATVADIRLQFPKHKTNHKNKGIVQTKTFSENYPYHDAGLDGTGQIVGIGDTGIDELSCFFRNSDNSKVARSTHDAPTFDLTKRKVIQYIAYGDDTDLEEGHGTHVAGTVAGDTEGAAFKTDGGHAPGAKIAFFDMENSVSPDDGIIYPSPLGDNVFQPAYTAGARIHTNSWGGPLNAYSDVDSFSADSFQYTHADFLALFAAGNEGAEGFYSIGEPGISKNSLTVGASGSDYAGEISQIAYFSSLGPSFDGRIKVSGVARNVSSPPPHSMCSLMSSLLVTPRLLLMRLQLGSHVLLLPCLELPWPRHWYVTGHHEL